MSKIISFGKVLRMAMLTGLLGAIMMVAKSNMTKMNHLFPDGSANGITVTETFVANFDQIKQILNKYLLPGLGDLPSDDQDQDQDMTDEDN